MSPKSGEAISGMLEMFLAAKDSVSHASESSSADFILANDRYQLLDRPCRRLSDTEVAWMMLTPPGDKDPTPSTPVPTNNPVGDTAPNTPLSRTSRRVSSLRDHAPGILHRSPSQASSAPDNTSRMSIHRSIPTQSNTSLGSPVIPDQAALTRDSDQLGIEQTLSRSVSNTSSISYASRTSIGSHAAPSAVYAPGTPTGASHTSLPVSEWPNNEEALSRPSSPPTHLHELPFAHSIIETIEIPTPGPLDKFLPIPGLSLETITTRDTPLLKIKTNMMNRSTTSVLSRASLWTNSYPFLASPSKRLLPATHRCSR
ncbi:hypothetical protein P691DRAFT_769265 [Macrolepiota fuliginosa MF-IS2]|uniref:Uncharacterized protein n=1 Tax=Macrolepiota fuliginosa MF-IS2 TaxID=1400762 RepID=A0A9P6BVD7_9AGAR|nr:hypothetical protein P691DRAFT_769265 [Macrolepiota fuliginosa MF-IS2]